MPKVTRRIFSLGLLGLAAGCIPAQVQDFIKAQRQSNLAQARQVADDKEAIQGLQIKLEILERDLANEKYCRSGKKNEFNSRITEFIRELEKGTPGVCQPGPLEDGMRTLGSQPYANAYFRPAESIKDIRLPRKGHLLTLLDPRYIRASTRFLILVQPEEVKEEKDTPAANSRALRLGEQYKELIGKLSPTIDARSIIGPFLLPCRLRPDVSRRFQGPMDVTLPDEPAEDKPRIRVWCVRTDCG